MVVVMESDKIEEMRKKLLVCAVCMDEYADPRILQCHHSFCLKCIEDLIQSLPINARSFSCPHCRQDSPIPRHGVDKLPVNFYLVSLRDELGAAIKSGMCHVCGLAHVQFQCVDCNLSICRFCIAPHRLEQHSARSQIQRLPTSASSLHGMTSNSCEVHNGEMLQLFCSTCQQPICITCSCSQTHSRHRLIPLSEQLQEIKNTMQKELDRIIQEQQNAFKSKSSIEALKKSLVTSSHETISNLNRVAAESCQTIMRRSSQLESEITTSTECQIAKMNDVQNRLQKYIENLDKGQDFLLDLQDSDICMEVIDCYKKFLSTLKETRNNFTSTNASLQLQSFMPSCGVRAKEVDIVALKTQLLCGNLGVLTYKKQKLFVDKKSLQVIPKAGKILGLFSSNALLKIGLFFTSFLFFNYTISHFDRSLTIVNSLEAEIANIGDEMSRKGRAMTDFGVRVFEDFFIPP